MRFEWRELKPHAEQVLPEQLQVGSRLFVSFIFSDEDGVGADHAT
jgi:hypothetical protein